MYIFAKFVSDHIFLQNHDKLNIKNSLRGEGPSGVCRGRRRETKGGAARADRSVVVGLGMLSFDLVGRWGLIAQNVSKVLFGFQAKFPIQFDLEPRTPLRSLLLFQIEASLALKHIYP
jgi:hypothetical protein